MRYPIEQSDIDKAIEKINRRKILEVKKIKTKHRQKFNFRMFSEIKELDRRCDYAIWKDK